ncbi:MAG: hypothetical protein V2I97_23060 [Desulfococcaceae bacterium]|jgi:hypothetical protein|nr:hypothetical protein [Desulfococcaceae bacterium]
MSNHGGSYMLNAVLELLEENDIFKMIGKDKTLELIKGIIKISHREDCNTGEILEDIGERLGICYYCLNYAENLEYGLCPECQ